jgi:hypothetical protein
MLSVRGGPVSQTSRAAAARKPSGGIAPHHGAPPGLCAVAGPASSCAAPRHPSVVAESPAPGHARSPATVSHAVSSAAASATEATKWWEASSDLWVSMHTEEDFRREVRGCASLRHTTPACASDLGRHNCHLARQLCDHAVLSCLFSMVCQQRARLCTRARLCRSARVTSPSLWTSSPLGRSAATRHTPPRPRVAASQQAHTYVPGKGCPRAARLAWLSRSLTGVAPAPAGATAARRATRRYAVWCATLSCDPSSSL